MITPTPPEDVNPTNQDNFSNINHPNLLSTLKQLQTLIKQEAMQKEIVLDIRDNLFGELIICKTIKFWNTFGEKML